VEDIAKKVGFSSRNGLFDAFETVKGISPANYRKENAQNDLSGINLTSFSRIFTNIVYFLHSHYTEDLSLERVAKEFHYNETYFSNMLSSNGTTFTDLLAEIRIYYACKLLLISEYTNEEIGQKIGFKSPETFYRTFKKLRSVTPTRYQKDNKFHSDSVLGKETE
jgi:two-component system response regulator YesN